MKLFSKKMRLVSLIILAGLLTSLFASCQNDQANGEDKKYEATKIRINLSEGYAGSVLHIMMLNKILDDKIPENVSVEWTSINGSNNIRDALVANQTDIGAIISTSVIVSMENNMPVTIIGSSALHSGAIYSRNENITSIDKINTANRVAVNNIGGAWHLALMLKCKDLYGNPKEIDDKLLAMTNADMIITAETSDTLDCFITTFPFTLQANKNDKLTRIQDLTSVLSEYDIRTLLVSSEKFFDNNPYLIDIFYEAAKETIDYMNENVDETAKILADYYGDLEAEDVKSVLTAAPPKLEISESAYDNVASIMYEVGMLSNPPKKFSELPNYDSIPKTP